MAGSERRRVDDIVVGDVRPTLVALWVFFATLGATFSFSFLEPADAASRAATAILWLVVVGAVAGFARLGGVGWVVTLGAAGVAAAVRLLMAWYMAGTYQGNTLVTERQGYIGYLVIAQLVGIAALAGGYWGMTAVRRVRQGRARTALVGTIVALAGTVGLAQLAVSGPIILDPASESTAVHRVTITESAITVDATTVRAGEVTWLATMRGDAPRDLTLVSVEGRVISGIVTPASGSTDFLIQRGPIGPGHYYFTAGLTGDEPPSPDPSGGLPPMPRGRLVAEFEVVP